MLLFVIVEVTCYFMLSSFGKMANRDLHKLAQAMCSIDLADSIWTQVSLISFQTNSSSDYIYKTNAVMLLCFQNTFYFHSNFQELPQLPIPDLWLTVSRYENSLKAVLAPTKRTDDEKRVERSSSREMEEDLVSQEETAGLLNSLTKEQVEAMRSQFERTHQLVRQFMLNEGPQLQRDLKEYKNKNQNWVSWR